MNTLKGRNFLKLLDFTAPEIEYLIALSLRLKADKRAGVERKMLCGKNIVLIFEKDSTRTRCAFEVAALDQGAHVTYLGPTGSQMGKKESVKDTARVLGRMYDGIEYRGYGQAIVEQLGEYAGVPVWNGLTTEFHPTQMVADLMTMTEHSTKPLKDIKFCFVGDAGNNVANSLMVAASKLGMDFRAIAPEECRPEGWLVERCGQIAAQSGAKITLTDDIAQGVKGCDFIYTDVWVSMGESSQVWQQRIELLSPYRVDMAMIRATENPDTKFLHCLPAFHNLDTAVAQDINKQFGLEQMEVSEELFESAASVVFDQAENRMHSIKAIMVATLAQYE